MRYLLDTHTLLWCADGNACLPSSVIEVVENDSNDIAISIASLWEIAIKMNIGKLSLRVSLAEFTSALEEAGPRIIGVTRNHILKYSELPLHHRDPFDRMLIAQAMAEKRVIIGCDCTFQKTDLRF